MITTGNMLLTRKSSQQQTNLTYQLKPSWMWTSRNLTKSEQTLAYT
jgi:hypothetical protein